MGDSPHQPDRDGAPPVAFLPALGVLAIWIVLMPADGGYFPRDWSPAGLALVGLWAVTVLAGGRLMPRPAAARAAVAVLLLLVGLAYLSMLWSASPATAWSTANQFLTVVVTVWTLALLPWSAAWAQGLMGLFGASVAAVLGISLVSALSAGDLAPYFVESRWADPLGYPNAVANFGFLAALPLLAVSATPERQPWLKAAALGVATFAAGCALLPQSRGSLLSLIVAVPILVALAPCRWRLVLRVGIAGVALAVASGPIFGVFDALRDERTFVSGPLGDALRAIALAALAAAAAGLAVSLVEARMVTGERTRRIARRSGVAAGALLGVTLVAMTAVNSDRIARVAEKQRAAWEQPRERYEGHREKQGSRLLDPDPLQRFEYWHISLEALAERPLVGLGAGGFGPRYSQERAYAKYALFPHSLFMRTAAEAGILGIVGVLAFVVAVVAGLLRRLGEAGEATRTVVAAAAASGVLFVVHAQFDWLEEFPVLAAPALGFLLVAIVVRERERETAATPGSAPRWARRAAVAVAATAMAATLAVPYLSLRYVERASATWRSDPAAAYADLDRAAALNPLSDVPRLSEGTIALRRREYARARAAFEAALEREPGWLGHFELALIEAAGGDRRAAMRHLEIARRLNPQERAITAVAEEIRSGGPVDPAALNRRLFDSRLFIRRRLT